MRVDMTVDITPLALNFFGVVLPSGEFNFFIIYFVIM